MEINGNGNVSPHALPGESEADTIERLLKACRDKPLPFFEPAPLDRPLRAAFFCAGSKAVNIFEVSHWWVAPDVSAGPALCIVTRSGKQINFDANDGRGDGYAVEKHMLAAIKQINRLQ